MADLGLQPRGETIGHISFFHRTGLQPGLLYYHLPGKHKFGILEGIPNGKIGREKITVDLVANRGNFKRNYWGGRRIPGSYRRGETEVTWGSSDVLKNTPLESIP